MPDPTPIRLALELVAGAEPITGRITSGDGVDHPFRGWLELAVALEDVRGAPAAEVEETP